MSKPVKEMIAVHLRERYAETSNACVIEMSGLDVQAQEKIRGQLRGKSARVEIVKNRLARHAFKSLPLEPLGKSLTGPCALVTGTESLIDIARLLVEAAKEFKALKLKNAIFDGDPSLMTVEELAKMRGRKELLGEVAMLIASPGRALAGCLRSPQAKIAGCLKKIAEKGE